MLTRRTLINWLGVATSATLSACTGGGSRVPRPTDATRGGTAVAGGSSPTVGRALSRSEKAAFHQTNPRWWENVSRPDGVSEEVEPGRRHFRGLVTFKLEHRVIEGRAKTLVWENGLISIRGVHESGSPYVFAFRPDLSNAKLSSVFVGD